MLKRLKDIVRSFFDRILEFLYPGRAYRRRLRKEFRDVKEPEFNTKGLILILVLLLMMFLVSLFLK